MNTLPFMHQTQTAGSGSKPRPSADSEIAKGAERSSFEPVMRNAASRTATQKSSARGNSGNHAQNNADVARQEHKQSGRDEDLAGAAVAAQDSHAARSDSAAKTRARSGAEGDGTGSKQSMNGTDGLPPGAEGLNQKAAVAENSAGMVLTKAESEHLRSNLKAAIQILEQNPAGRKIASELQNILHANANNVAPTGADELAHMKLSEAQTQKLQEILAALKQLNAASPIKNNLEEGAQLKGKLTDILALVEQTVRRAQQGAQVQTVSHLKQPEIVEGFLLRSEQDRGSVNAAAKIDDPRFAALLNKATDFSSLRERQGQQNAQPSDIPSGRLTGMNPQEQAQSLIQQARAEVATASAGANGEAGATGKGVLDGQAQLGSGNTATPGSATADLAGMKGMAEAATAKDNAPVDFSAAQKGTGLGNNSTDPGILTLKNGTTIPNARVVDQTVQHLNLHARGDSSVVTVKLYPEELGELNIRMVMEGDQLKLQIQAQNQQVREILEQNFPRLRTAMEDQGVTVEDFQVSLGDSRAEDQAGTQSDDELARRRNADGTTGIAEANADESESADSSRRATSTGGLSVHV